MIAIPFIFNSLCNFVIGIILAKLLGPAEFGRYAVALSAAIVLQTLTFEWLRLCAVRFYNEHDRIERPAIRATLDVAFATLIAVAAILGAGLYLFDIQLSVPPGLVALAIAAAAVFGLYEIAASFLRARFLNRAYGLFVVNKTMLSLVLTAGGAYYTGSAKAALCGLIISPVGALVLNRNLLRDRNARFSLADRALLLRFAAYAFPVVIATVLYQAVPLVNRALIAPAYGFAEAGQMSLAFDMGSRGIGAIGAMLDVLLFQLAVDADRKLGIGAARDQIARNMGVALVAVMPVIAGLWLVLPSFEALVIPEQFRGPFAHYLTILLPGFACAVVTNQCLMPVFQIAHRTAPLIFGGLAALLTNLLAIALLPRSVDASSFALAQTMSSLAGLAVALGFMIAGSPVWPARRDMAGTAVALILMVCAVAPLRGHTPGLVTFLLQAGLGGLVYGAAVLAHDTCGLRTAILGKRGPRWRSPGQAIPRERIP